MGSYGVASSPIAPGAMRKLRGAIVEAVDKRMSGMRDLTLALARISDKVVDPLIHAACARAIGLRRTWRAFPALRELIQQSI
eukprot:15468138-Alexandrium_andersonii.AAC.1